MHKMTLQAKLGWGVMTALVVLLALFALRYPLFGQEAFFEQQRDTYIRHETGIMIHVTAMMVGVLMGPLQFLRSFRDKHRAVHRSMGKAYLVFSSIGAASGLYMSFFSYADAISGVSFSSCSAPGCSCRTTWRTRPSAAETSTRTESG